MSQMKYFRGVVRCALVIFVFFSIGAYGIPVHAEDSLSVTVTPPLFQLTIGPGEKWSSSIKVVNNNSHDVTYYAEVMNFEAQGETGSSKFTPLINESPKERSVSLANWIQISRDPIPVLAGTSRDIQFTVDIPSDAEPGGHYAAILIGTQPPSDYSGNVVKVSSYVSSLLFVRIKGDVIESGRIREFTTDKTLYQTPSANFAVRFENMGNTHLQPQGDIMIFNMWGKERGRLEINQKSNFGNVLPKSIRKFQFSWIGEQSAFDIGRYSAVVTLAYGDGAKQNTSAVTYFWVVPIVPVAGTLGGFLIFVFLVTWFIRRYIRRALALSLSHAAITNIPLTSSPELGIPQKIESRAPMIKTIMEPIREGVIDLRGMRNTKKVDSVPLADSVSSRVGTPLTTRQFFTKYRLFFIFIVLVLTGCIGAWWYFTKALTPKRSFKISDVTIKEEPLSPPASNAN